MSVHLQIFWGPHAFEKYEVVLRCDLLVVKTYFTQTKVLLNKNLGHIIWSSFSWCCDSKFGFQLSSNSLKALRSVATCSRISRVMVQYWLNSILYTPLKRSRGKANRGWTKLLKSAVNNGFSRWSPTTTTSPTRERTRMSSHYKCHQFQHENKKKVKYQTAQHRRILARSTSATSQSCITKSRRLVPHVIISRK